MRDHEIVTELVDAFRFKRFRSNVERDVQAGIEDILKTLGLAFTRETAMSDEDRPDFIVCGNIALEVKVKGGLAEVTRQLHRYAELPAITAVVLITTKRQHHQIVPLMMGKPVHVISIGRGVA